MMASQKTIDQQRQRLAAHRATLAHYLFQRAQLGTAHEPPGVANGIAEARAGIAHCKAILRGWGVEVAEHPDDNGPSAPPTRGAAPLRSRPWFWPLRRHADAPPDPAIDRANRQVLIADMRLRIQERLATAPKLILLQLAARPDAVAPPGVLNRPYDLARRQPGQPDEPLPARTKIGDLYTEHNRQLLILGAPGSGKTFLLHELARELVELAVADETAPVPVVFVLATWQPDIPLDAWLIADLSRRYGAKPALITRLVQGGTILPLLDGLDEVATQERRVLCVAAINAYRASRDRLPPLVVTCREREYQDLPPLQVNTALVVQSLARVQINRYLAGVSYAGLRAVLEHDDQLANAAHTPLLLSLMAATYRDQAPNLPAAADADALRAIILGDYSAGCLAPAKDPHGLRVPPPQLRAFLAWLARCMTAHANQQEFFIEFLQPSWLPSCRWRWLWRGSSILGIALAGGLGSGLLYKQLLGLDVGLLYELVVGLVLGLPLVLGQIEPAEQLSWSWQRFVARLSGNLAYGLVFGLVFGLIGGLVSGLVGGLVSGLLFVLIIVLFLELIDSLRAELLHERITPNQGIRRSLRSAFRGSVVVGLVSGLVFGLVSGLFLGLVSGLFYGLVGGLVFGLVFGPLYYGGAAVIKHYVLRLILPLCTPTPLDLVRWLEEACTRGLLVRVGGGYRFYHELLQRHFAEAQRDR
jgi:NACHT domain